MTSVARRNSGHTALIIAVQKKDIGLITVLTRADLKALNVKDKDDYAALHHCVFVDSELAASVLLNSGADVNIIGRDGRSPLHSAASNERVGIVKVLLDHSANARIKDRNGKAPHELAKKGSYVGQLLKSAQKNKLSRWRSTHQVEDDVTSV